NTRSKRDWSSDVCSSELMAETIAVFKILRIREQEKMDAEKSYQQSMAFFENIATWMYTLLKRKETAESSFESGMQDIIPIEKIKEQVDYIEELNKQIIKLQTEVNKARNEMDAKQSKLTDAHIEVKKFEKLIARRKQVKKAVLQKYENEAMNEISIQQYLRKQTGG